MRFDLDAVFAPYLKALQLGDRRLEVLAANIANADTPGYYARDIDFKAAMRAAQGEGVGLDATHSGHIRIDSPSQAATPLYRTAVQSSLDGNTVDTDRESAAVAETAVRYEAALMFFNSKIRGLQMAITGGR